MSNLIKYEQPQQTQSTPREIRIRLPEFKINLEKGPAFVATVSGTVACVVVMYLLGEISDLKKQQNNAEDRIKKEVLMPGGATTYKTEFKEDPKRDTAKDSVVEAPSSVKENTAAAPPAEPGPPPMPPAPRATGPGNIDVPYGTGPAYQGSYGPSGPGNM